ncbi:MAG: hypothetical protein IT308_00375 [Anaerolineaceae bacterium]|nr:hypothetical protein [Anaerolineaceae bacterium]
MKIIRYLALAVETENRFKGAVFSVYSFGFSSYYSPGSEIFLGDKKIYVIRIFNSN